MRKLFFTSLVIFFTMTLFGQQTSDKTLAIIPEPVSVSVGNGYFQLPENVTVLAPSNKELGTSLQFLKTKIATATGKSVEIVNKSSKADIVLQLNKKSDAAIGDEG